MEYKLYKEQEKIWPSEGQHILANYDESSISVYQAYRPAIADYAVKHQQFGGEFSVNRMSWIKPNFLWMMYRAGWATKEGQERILEIRLKQSFFDEILARAVPSQFVNSEFSSQEDWKRAIEVSDVRLQWDPDHDPKGASVTRRAIQLGLRGETLKRYATTELIYIKDITDFVAEQRNNIDSLEKLLTPVERIYSPKS
ncbi:MAG TPA: DUF4291 domain-containing protein [Cellvibrio sp.]|nr:DUF4291 domain-containing protein [Cellvibrio sp.]